MEKALSIVSIGSKKASSFWLTKKAKEELNNITKDLNTVTNAVEEKAKMLFEKLKGMPQDSLSDLLKRHNLPLGLFPEKIISFEYDKLSSKLIVHLLSPCEVTFGDRSVVRYSTRVKAILRNNKLTYVEGMRIKVLLWVNVTGVYVEGLKSDKVSFITAGVTKSRPMAAYNYHGKAAIVAEF